MLVKDIAEVGLGPELRRGLVELNGEGEVVGGVVVMRLGEKEITGRFPADMAPEGEESVELAFDMNQACIFDPVTEKLL